MQGSFKEENEFLEAMDDLGRSVSEWVLWRQGIRQMLSDNNTSFKVKGLAYGEKSLVSNFKIEPVSSGGALGEAYWKIQKDGIFLN